ncbi:MAG: FAD binding domain-containing protein [Thaumarchaeota archaeon]|nr:FAD binding domain-containing protein [Nitrososphaerota archaeon]
MVFDPSDVLRPSSFQDAVELLDSPDSRIVAGNTNLYSLAKKGGLDNIKKLVDISKLGISYVREEPQERDSEAEPRTSEKKTILVGAGTTFQELASSPLISGSPEFAGLKEALNLSPPQIRNVATIGGSICSAVSYYDAPVILLALGTTLKFFSKNEGERLVAIESFFQDPVRYEKDLLLEYQFASSPNSASSFVKLCRRMSGYGVLMTAAKIRLDHTSRKIDNIRLAIGAMTEIPQRLNHVEEKLQHKEPTIETVTEMCEKSADSVRDLIPSVHASVAYKKQVLPSLLRDSIMSAVERVQER